ncbi:MAG: hypothetical protein LBP59_15055 [Planctomycetaceae bacterium]|nr:hypothetical protein [Planctomycetaceae bacterium]
MIPINFLTSQRIKYVYFVRYELMNLIIILCVLRRFGETPQYLFTKK